MSYLHFYFVFLSLTVLLGVLLVPFTGLYLTIIGGSCDHYTCR